MTVPTETEPEVPEFAIHRSVVGDVGTETLTHHDVLASNHTD
jgi:hypothetical protein